MRIALIEWPTLDDDTATHVIAANALTDEQLKHRALRWAVMSLSAKAYIGCTVTLITVDPILSTMITVKEDER